MAFKRVKKGWKRSNVSAISLKPFLTESHNGGHEPVKRRNIYYYQTFRFVSGFSSIDGIFRSEPGALIYPKLRRSREDVLTQDLWSKMEFSVSNIYQNLRAQGTLSECFGINFDTQFVQVIFCKPPKVRTPAQ